MRRALYGTRQMSWLWQKAVDRALQELDVVHHLVVPCTYFREAWDMALTYHGDYFMSESEPQYQDMLDGGLARYFDLKCLGRIGPGFRAEGRFLKRSVSWSVEGFVWHGDPAKVGQFIALMEIAGCRSSAVPGTKATGPQSTRCRSGAGGQCDEVGSAGVRAHHVHRHGPARSAVQVEDGDEHHCEAFGDHEVADSEDREVPGKQASGVRVCVPERGGRVHGVRRQPTGLAIAGHADQKQRCWKSWETTGSPRQ